MELYLKELNKMLEVAKTASKLVLDVYYKDFEVEIKEDNSPVTMADKKADDLIRNELSKEFPNYAFLTEEHKDNLERLNYEYVFIVDPVDGTEDFVHKDDEFSINIALSRNHEIVASVTAIPAYNLIYYALKNFGAYKLDLNSNLTTRIFVSSRRNNLICLTSRYHLYEDETELINRHSDKIVNVKKAGSAYKACLIAEGKADITYRLHKGTKERDTASFTLLVKEAFGIVLDLNKKEIKYNRENPYNENYIVVNSIDNWLI